ncbi:FAD/NAD-binding domain-containing protein [Fomitiporia mediterranea MF3/22]|uniref:FAD/NAD-binding domain-containing protein n=1 Tax=Fomitiporia mediterranea (strain MF3/22) TaxID=694068 RepID=UPI0004408C21|nr:FAD/NAD-binding domain-containing protein [Fomitiporia mediterranea MF3/22]EJD00227.1 FAD/NAD-binding domain-containing protein [Fomitiporia mediterranea MF3/22]
MDIQDETHLRLHVIIVGCGVGGLSAAHCLSQAGHSVTVVESAHAFREVGTGIQISPNASRLLARWGLGDKLDELGVKPDGINLLRYDDGRVIGYRCLGNIISRTYGAPYYNIHRADLHSMLLSLVATSPRVTIRLCSTVKKIDPIPNPNVNVTLTSGEVLAGDMIVGADGLKSLVRSIVSKSFDALTPAGDAAYRATIKANDMLADTELSNLIDARETTIWMGPRRHVVGYPIKAKQEYNVVMLHPDDGSVNSWTAQGNVEQMRDSFKDFEPRVRKLLSLVNNPMKWRLMDCKPLDSWVHPDGRVVLLGDSCHPMLPYKAQGAAVALEDSAVLGALLSRLSDISDLSQSLRTYEHLRKGRATKIQKDSRDNQYIFHLPDGPAQQARDLKLRAAMELELNLKRHGHDSSGQERIAKGSGFNADQYSYDANKVVEQWREIHSEVVRKAV